MFIIMPFYYTFLIEMLRKKMTKRDLLYFRSVIVVVKTNFKWIINFVPYSGNSNLSSLVTGLI